MTDIVERGMLKHLSQGARWYDKLAEDQRDTLMRLSGKGLAEWVHGAQGAFARLTDEGWALIREMEA